MILINRKCSHYIPTELQKITNNSDISPNIKDAFTVVDLNTMQCHRSVSCFIYIYLAVLPQTIALHYLSEKNCKNFLQRLSLCR